MVKRQKERLYESSREHRARLGGGNSNSNSQSSERPLPFSHCALSLTAYTKPVTTIHSQLLFDHSHLLAFVLKHKVDPVTGTPMTIQDIIALTMDRDAEGRWQCPVTTKPFNNYSKIVGILQQQQQQQKGASVYSYAAYQEFNAKTKHYEDLVTGVQFDPAKGDVLILYDPQRRPDIQTFYHIRNAREMKATATTETTTASSNVRHTLATSRIMEKIQQRKTSEERTSAMARLQRVGGAAASSNSTDDKHAYFRSTDGSSSRLPVLSSDVTGVVYTDASVSSALMSTAVSSSSSNNNTHGTTERLATAEELATSLYRQVRLQRRKGYVQLHVNIPSNSSSSSISPLIVELHCDMVPMTCANFLGLCREQRYDGTRFHRCIPNFMIQGGKPATTTTTTTTKEDSSYWGNGPFRDEFDDRLRHSGPGILSMANSGPHTNQCQFFITFKSCPHLDRKHSIFGTVINENRDELLALLEAVPTDAKSRPLQPVVLERTEIVEDPVADAREKEQERFEALVLQREGGVVATTTDPVATDDSNSSSTNKVGKYLSLTGSVRTSKNSARLGTDSSEPLPNSTAPSPPKKKSKFGNFSKW